MEAEAVPIVADAYNEAVGIAVGVFLAALALLLLVRLAPLLLDTCNIFSSLYRVSCIATKEQEQRRL